MNLQKAKDVLSKFPRLELGTLPTPLHRMSHLQAKLDTSLPLYIKRDDLTGLGPGGNKVRNLEYLLGDMVKQGGDIVLASGKNQSNLCALTVSAWSTLGWSQTRNAKNTWHNTPSACNSRGGSPISSKTVPPPHWAL